MNDDNIEDGELVEQPRQEVITKSGHTVPPMDAKIEKDYLLARDNMHQLLSHGMIALEDALEIARTSELSKDWDAYTNLFDKLSSTNIKLLEAAEKYSKLLPKSAKEDANQAAVTNNTAVFVGTSQELEDVINKMGQR